jgi:alkanesulfonate monooxygenase SsuD/methylene tetrahydromethanopterin reductase-like flavin-dependent oxidoreductase (luciferase family)
MIWSTRVMVADTEREAAALRERMIAGIPQEAVGVWLSHNTGFDMSTLPERFTLGELNRRLVAASGSPAGFVHTPSLKHGMDSEISSTEFFVHGLRAATGQGATFAGTAAQVPDRAEEVFEATGSRSGFTISLSRAPPRQVIHNIADSLAPEL